MKPDLMTLEEYVSRRHEALVPGCRYVAEDRLIYRVRGGESEDFAELPPELFVASMPFVRLPAGQFVGVADDVRKACRLAGTIALRAGDLDRMFRWSEVVAAKRRSRGRPRIA